MSDELTVGLVILFICGALPALAFYLEKKRREDRAFYNRTVDRVVERWAEAEDWHRRRPARPGDLDFKQKLNESLLSPTKPSHLHKNSGKAELRASANPERRVSDWDGSSSTIWDAGSYDGGSSDCDSGSDGGGCDCGDGGGCD